MPENPEIFRPMTNLKRFEQMVDIYGVPCDVHPVRTFHDGRQLGAGYELGRPSTWFVYDREDGPVANGQWHKHCGPFSVFEEAVDWIEGIREESTSRPHGPEPSRARPEEEKVTRFEVIDHTTTDGEVGRDFGRVFVRYGVRVTLSYQDDGRTLKVFLDHQPFASRPHGPEPPQTEEPS